MKSRASCFNMALARNMLRRRWPFWLGVFALLFLLLPMQLINAVRLGEGGALDTAVLADLEMLPPLAFALCILTVMLQFAFLYSSRSCGLVNSLPLRRTAVFCTAYLVGLVPLLLLELLVTLLTLALAPLCGVRAGTLFVWLGAAVCCTLCFYGLASFCAMLTGNILVLPAVYTVLNFVSAVFWGCITVLRETLVYGFSESFEQLFTYLCPLPALIQALSWQRWSGAVAPSLILPAVYALAGLALSALALRLYQRRRMETATDTVAIACLKPVFLYCMALGTALLLPWALTEILNTPLGYGRAAFFSVLALLLLGAALGWAAGKMILEKTVRLSGGRWKGLLLVCLALALLCCALEFDLTGFETRVPEAEEVESVAFTYGGTVLREEENIDAALELHRSLIAHKSEFDRAESPLEGGERQISSMVYLRYTLRNGSVLSRRYLIRGTLSELDDPASPVARYAALMNAPEALESQTVFTLPVRAEDISDAYLAVNTGGYHHYTLTQEQAADFYENALLPDLHDGKIARFSYGVGEVPYADTEFYLSVTVPAADYPGFDGRGVQRVYMSEGPTWSEPQTVLWESKWYQLPMDAERCLTWIRENTGLEPQPSDITFSRSPYGVG